MLHLIGFLAARSEVFPLIWAAFGMLVVFGADDLALGIVEQPLVDLTIASGIELATGELPWLVE